MKNALGIVLLFILFTIGCSKTEELGNPNWLHNYQGNVQAMRNGQPWSGAIFLKSASFRKDTAGNKEPGFSMFIDLYDVALGTGHRKEGLYINKIPLGIGKHYLYDISDNYTFRPEASYTLLPFAGNGSGDLYRVIDNDLSYIEIDSKSDFSKKEIKGSFYIEFNIDSLFSKVDSTTETKFIFTEGQFDAILQ